MALSLPPTEPTVTLAAVPAPWHAGGAAWELSGAKTLSYAPNMAATRAARRSGKSDALLVSNEGWVLEGPTFSVGWVHDGVLETPTLDLGILDSITRRVLLEEAEGRGVAVVEGTFDLDRLLGADEALAFSTVKEVTPVIEVDDRNYPIGEVSIKLAGAFAAGPGGNPDQLVIRQSTKGRVLTGSRWGPPYRCISAIAAVSQGSVSAIPAALVISDASAPRLTRCPSSAAGRSVQVESTPW